MQGMEGRRPLKTRDTRQAQQTARWLSRRNITPNQISVMSVLCAALAGACLLMLPQYGGWILPMLAAVFIQLRLLCNLLDGMVAIEGGKSTPSGELYNDIPDRIADALIFVAAGYSISVVDWAVSLGWFCGLMAVFTAYVRVLTTSIGAPTDFRGPMAKQHRMALMTGACILAAIEPLVWSQGYALLSGLIIIGVGCCLTVWNRTKAAYRYLERQGDD